MTISRMCIATRKVRPIEELFRIVLVKGEILIDTGHELKGRGAYLTKDKDVILNAKKKNLLAKSLKHQVDSTIYDKLLQLL